MSIGILVDVLYNVVMPETEIKKIKRTPQKKIDDIAKKKELFKQYYRQLPIVKLCAGKIGVTRETVYRWMEEDITFMTQLEELKYEFAMENLPQVKNREWVLERILREHFTPRTEITGANGKDLMPTPIMGGKSKNVSGNNNIPEDSKPQEEN
jgi:hypothetical protein